MALTYYERKARLPHGAVSQVAKELGCAVSKVSDVLSESPVRDRLIETRLAQLMRDPVTNKKVTVTEAFGAPARTLRRVKAAV